MDWTDIYWYLCRSIWRLQTFWAPGNMMGASPHKGPVMQKALIGGSPHKEPEIRKVFPSHDLIILLVHPTLCHLHTHCPLIKTPQLILTTPVTSPHPTLTCPKSPHPSQNKVTPTDHLWSVNAKSMWVKQVEYIHGLMEDCSISSTLAMDILQSCIKPLNYEMNQTTKVWEDRQKAKFDWDKIWPSDAIVLFHKDFSPSGEQLEHCKLAHEL